MINRCTRTSIFCVGITLIGCARSDNEFKEPPPPVVNTARPIQHDVAFFIEQNGETEAKMRAEVRARIRGLIEDVHFDPGQMVAEDDPLFEIEREEYEAKKKSADALVKVADAAILVAQASQEAMQSEVERAEADFKRYEQLRQTNAASEAEYLEALASRDAARAQLQTAEASIESARAELSRAEAEQEQAELDLNYTTISAPIAGYVSRTLIDEGNLVENGSILATIVDRSQIYVYFNISDRTLLDIIAADPSKTQTGPADWEQVPVLLRRDEREDDWLEGNLEYVDREGLDQATGTFSLRAVFRNEAGLLLPGMFVTVRLQVGQLENAILIPQQALTRSQAGDFVLLVNDNNEVVKRNVKLGQQLGRWIVVTEGMTTDDAFVLDGLQRAIPEKKVEPNFTKLSAQGSPDLQLAIQYARADQSELKASGDEATIDQQPAVGEDSAPPEGTRPK